MGRCHNDRCKKCYRKDCRDNKCVREVVIKSLPKLIDEPGTYCLCKDFEWVGTSPAITISAANVVLNFNTKRITVSGGNEPVVEVLNSNDVVLNDVDIFSDDGNGSGVYVNLSANVVLNRPVFNNLGTNSNVTIFPPASYGLLAVECNGITTDRAHVKNDANSSLAHYYVDSSNVRTTNGNYYHGNVLHAGGRNILVQNNLIEQGGCGFRSNRATSPAVPILYPIENAKVLDNEIISVGTSIAVLGFGPCQAIQQADVLTPIKNVMIENNVVKHGNLSHGIFLQLTRNTTIRNNMFEGSGSTLDLEDYAFSIDALSVNGTRGTLIEGNNIRNSLFGISMEATLNDADRADCPDVSEYDDYYTTIRNNKISETYVAITDNVSPLLPPPLTEAFQPAFFLVISDNVLQGNQIAYAVRSPSTYIAPNNIVHELNLVTLVPS